MSENPVTFDKDRVARIGLDEAVLAGPKSDEHLATILRDAVVGKRRLLLTRLGSGQMARLPNNLAKMLDYCPLSRTGILGQEAEVLKSPRIALVSAGTSDAGPVAEARRVLAFAGYASTEFADVGVAGLWRILACEDALREMDVVIVFAGMDGALPSVVAGLVPGLVIAVPTSVGYGVAAGGQAALNTALASCAPGLTVVNIDNGYGAACAAIRFGNTCRRMAEREE